MTPVHFLFKTVRVIYARAGCGSENAMMVNGLSESKSLLLY
jgi:hypothetical protein